MSLSLPTADRRLWRGHELDWGGTMQELIGKEVEVNTSDIVYKGVLIEVGEDGIYLQSQSGWTFIPLDKVADVRAAE